jgi:hypothetical protein
MNIPISKLKFSYANQPINRYHKPVFKDCNGDGVVIGDVVEWTKDGEHLPTSGTVYEKDGKLKIEAFDMLAYKWQNYAIVDEDGEPLSAPDDCILRQSVV